MKWKLICFLAGMFFLVSINANDPVRAIPIDSTDIIVGIYNGTGKTFYVVNATGDFDCFKNKVFEPNDKSACLGNLASTSQIKIIVDGSNISCFGHYERSSAGKIENAHVEQVGKTNINCTLSVDQSTDLDVDSPAMVILRVLKG